MKNRRSIRLRDYDYTQDGAYFVTICTAQRNNIFGDIQEGEMNLNTLGCVADDCWLAIPSHTSGVKLDHYVIMPNHVHGIIIINRSIHNAAVVGTQHAVSLQNTTSPNVSTHSFKRPSTGSLAAIVRSFKAATTRQINQLRQSPGGAVWQGRYYEHIIRHDADLTRIREYIRFNPARWAEDDYFQAERPSS